MRRLTTIIGGAIGVAVLGFSAAPAAGAAISYPPGHAHRSTCGAFWHDGSNGEGSSTSLVPGSSPSAGDKVVQAGSDAWRIRYDGNDGSLYPCAAPGFCYRSNSTHHVVLAACNRNHADQQWTQIVRNGISQFENAGDGRLLAASGGIGTQDVTSNSATGYHNHWKPESSA